MQRYRHDDPAEREPLDDPNAYFDSSPGRGHPQAQHYPQQRQNSRHRQQQEQYYDSRPDRHQQYPQQQQQQQHSNHYAQDPYAQDPYVANQYNSTPPRAAVGAHRQPRSPPDAQHLRSERRRSRDQQNWGPAAHQSSPPNPDYVSPISSPLPAGRGDDGRHWGQESGRQRQGAAPQSRPESNVTPGSDNFSEAAPFGGMANIAYSVAERNARESGLEAMRTANPHQQPYPDQDYHGGHHHPAPYNDTADRDSHSSMSGLGAAAIPPGLSTPGATTPSKARHPADVVYTDDPYSGYSRPNQAALGVVNPHDIYDDGDDGLQYGRKSQRNSMLSLGNSSNKSRNNIAGAAAGAGAGLAAANGKPGGYGPVSGLGNNVSHEEVHNLGGEKSWGMKPENKSRKWKIVVIVIVAVVVIAAIVCGILFGVVYRGGGNSNPSPGLSAADDQKQNGDLNANSAEIKAMMNNKNLHKVFMGMDYTPINTQYPECLKDPPSQNNITRDVAVLSQLTNTVRLYGTDCNQTEMVLTAIERLQLKDTVKVWLGVWQDKNTTTNERQLTQMWDILDKYGEKPFKGLIVANEILFREEMTTTQLQKLLSDTRTKLKQKGMTLPVATSDLGRDWADMSLVQASDYIMANIHPFFGGQPAEGAADWTMEFWKNNIKVDKPEKEKNVIAEIGWPSQGGQRCPPELGKSCPKPAIASVPELNRVLNDWVCPALNNGTNYFWFSAFDEPWKIRFNSKDENWEDHWGLMDVDRQLKDGIKIPDCGGKTAP
ncbi:hypothetical protein RB594_006281 [Gaeumannomyces avenae]